jgi:hypothetical protein
MAETRPLERLTASDLFSQAPQSGIPPKQGPSALRRLVLRSHAAAWPASWVLWD